MGWPQRLSWLPSSYIAPQHSHSWTAVLDRSPSPVGRGSRPTRLVLGVPDWEPMLEMPLTPRSVAAAPDLQVQRATAKGVHNHSHAHCCTHTQTHAPLYTSTHSHIHTLTFTNAHVQAHARKHAEHKCPPGHCR